MLSENMVKLSENSAVDLLINDAGNLAWVIFGAVACSHRICSSISLECDLEDMNARSVVDAQLQEPWAGLQHLRQQQGLELNRSLFWMPVVSSKLEFESFCENDEEH